jgi:hypothetical protein
MLMMVDNKRILRPLYTFPNHVVLDARWGGFSRLNFLVKPWNFSGRCSVSLIAVVLVPGSLNMNPTYLGCDMTPYDLTASTAGSSLVKSFCRAIKKR